MGRLLGVALSRHGVSERTAAEAMGLGPTEVHRMVEGTHRVDMDRLRAGLPEVARTLGELYADSIPERRRPSLPPTTRHLNATALHGRLAEELRQALADGTLTLLERKGIAMAALAAAEELRRLAADALGGG